MKKTSTTISMFKTLGLLSLALFAASCANDLKFVRVKGNESTIAQRTEAKTETRAYAIQKTDAQQPVRETAPAKPEGTEVAPSETLMAEQQTSTRQLVREEMKKNSTFNGLSESQQQKVENIITKRVDKVVAKKKAASPAPAPNVEFSRIMLIGLIILLAGILLGAIVGGLGWLAFVVGLGLIVYGLIIQL
ncbi:hypothetical protein [Solitalea canadensis]|uniref:Uncharacterized protein n=1 Tax=Solitalea canadensis (strain ATCC 29591 / DSM 3403 / JCM 21819 / LMG 8368 / NBRC 15130 / NCIMB 12057 / USAM 9D) TaxID=929556 RepID=H8KLQ2_SOLCM|nr:hypothetical protein [Solitalea canadensis]AFD09206.1 hypothetical protein Solca_4216 [Solitalea canadensis DSM 3403]